MEETEDNSVSSTFPLTAARFNAPIDHALSSSAFISEIMVQLDITKLNNLRRAFDKQHAGEMTLPQFCFAMQMVLGPPYDSSGNDEAESRMLTHMWCGTTRVRMP